MSIAEAIAASYRAYMGEALGILLIPWLVLVLWRRWLPRWPQTFLALAICVVVIPPLMPLLGRVSDESRSMLQLLLLVVPIGVIWMLRERNPAGARQPAPAPDPRWKLAAAFVGCFAFLSVLSVVAPGLRARPAPPQEAFSVREVLPPSYADDFKRALEGRDAWAAYDAYREAERYKDEQSLRPVIELYATLGDPTGVAFQALVARAEGRDAERRELQTRAAAAAEPLGMVLSLESARTDVESSGRRDAWNFLFGLSQREISYSDQLVAMGEYTESYLRCVPEITRPEACETLDPASTKPTALVDISWFRIWFFTTEEDGVDNVAAPGSVWFMDGLRRLGEKGETFGDVAKIPMIARSSAILHKAAGWPGYVPDDPYLSIPNMVDALREGIKHEDPESGLLLHEASFNVSYRDHIPPEEARAALQMAADWGHPEAMKRLAAMLEHGAGGMDKDPTLAAALLMARERYLEPDDPSGMEDAQRILRGLAAEQSRTAEFTVENWRPGFRMVLFNPEQWGESAAKKR